MKRKSASNILCGFVSCIVASLVLINEAQANGTEQLGPPSIGGIPIDIANGSGIFVSGTGLYKVLSGDIVVEVPGDVSISQVFLYWSGRTKRSLPDPGDTDTITVNSTPVTGSRIGGPTYPADSEVYPCSSYRADITTNGWIQVGQSNVLTVAGLDFSTDDGAAVVIIWDDGSSADIQIMDGSDFAYEPEDSQTMPVKFDVTPSTSDQWGYIWLIASDVDAPRPNAVEITLGDGAPSLTNNVLFSNEGDFLDVVKLDVTIPAGADSVTVQLFSVDDETDRQPASINWTFVSLVIPEPNTPPEGCTYTQGYWKNHIEAWPRGALSLYTMREAMTLLKTPPKGGNAYIILAHQYIAAKLNVGNGASYPDEADHALQTAKRILSHYMDQGTIPKRSPHRNLAIATANVLDAYNNGLIGPGHCDSTCDKEYTPQSDEKEVCENSQQNNKSKRSKRK